MTTLISSALKWFSPAPVSGRYRVRGSFDGRHHVDVVRTRWNWLLVLTPVTGQETLEQAWCYYGPDGFLRAVASAWLWDDENDEEPPGGATLRVLGYAARA